jgi:hypothetical protein
LSLSHPDKLAEAALAMHTAHWAEHRRIAEPEVIAEVLARVVGADVARDALERARSKEVKDLLASATQTAFDTGAFGLPWFQGTYVRWLPVSRAPRVRVGQREGIYSILFSSLFLFFSGLTWHASDKLERRDRVLLGV